MNNERPIQRIAPGRIEKPQDVAAFAEAVRHCAAAGEAIADYGSAHQGLGHPPPPNHVQIDAPAGVLEHYVPDMTVRVAAGTRLSDLQAELAKERQFLPIDADDCMTIAEVVTHNISGGLRAGNGSIRDALLGLRYIDAQGQVITVGGRTVKNVAGYDVTRLMVGSLNMLGLLAEVTLRTAAIPPHVTQMEVAGISLAAFSEAVTGLLASDAAPWSLEWEHADGTDVLRLGYAGTKLACDTQVRALETWLQQHGWSDAKLARRDVTLAQDQQDRAARFAWRRTAAAVGKLIVPPVATGRFVDALLVLESPPAQVHALPTHGIMHFGAAWPADQAQQVDEQLLAKLQELAGIRIWLRRPQDDHRLKPWAPQQPDWPLLLRLKKALDPHNLFNPGRFP